MISSYMHSVFTNKTCLVIDPSFRYATFFSNDKAKEVLDFISVAPKACSIQFTSIYNSSEEIDIESIDADRYEFKDYALERELDAKGFNILKKRCQGILVKYGIPVLDIYGIDLNGFLYGRDMGFEIIFEYVKFYVSFSLIHINSYSRRAYGYNFCNRNFIYHKIRKCGTFTDNQFNLNMSYIPSNVTNIFGDVPTSDMMTLPNMGIVIKNLWSSVGTDSIVVYDMQEKSIVCSIGLFDAIESANKIRSIGAEIFKKIATSPKLTSGYSNIATSKILSADAIEKIGDLILINTSNDSIIQTEAEFLENKFRFLSVSHPDDSTQYKLAHSASQSTILLNSCNVLSSSKLDEMLDNILAQLPSREDNEDSHYIKSETGLILGYLKSIDNIVYSSVSVINRENLNKLTFKENYLIKDDFRNIAAEITDSVSFREDLESTIENLISIIQKIDFKDIISNIQRIDRYVTNCFKSLASIIASQELINARAATLLKAADLILQMPLKTSYGAIEFGNLAMFIKITTLPDGTSIIKQDHSLDQFIPYQKALYQRQCFKDWCILNADPGQGLDNDVLIGDSYSSTVSDLQGNYLTTIEKEYIKTNRQTRGSGKSEQEVIPLTKLEPRRVMKLQKLIDQAISFLETILNNDLIKASRQISECVSSCVDATKRYADMRKPYLDQLIELNENQEQLFASRHFLSILNQRIPEELNLEFGSECFCTSIENDEETLSSLQIATINSVTNCIIKKDKFLEIDEFKHEINEVDELLVEANTEYLKNLSLYCASSPNRDDFNVDDDVFSFITYYSELEGLVDTESDELKGTSKLVGTETTIFYLKYYDNDYLSKDEWLIYIEDLMNRSLECYRRKLSIVNRIKNKMIELRDKEEEFSSISEKIKLETYHDHIIAHYEGNEIYYDLIKEDDGKFVYNLILIPNTKRTYIKDLNPDRTIFIGNLAYDLEVFAKQYFIYDSIPRIESIVKKIKYAMFSYTEVADKVLISKLREEYDNVVASAIGRYISKENRDIEDKICSIILCLLTDSERSLASILSLQGYTLNNLLIEMNLPPSTGGSIIETSSKLAI